MPLEASTVVEEAVSVFFALGAIALMRMGRDVARSESHSNQGPRRVEVRFGSLADIRERITDVRFASESGHAQRQHRCLLSARSRRSQAEGCSAPKVLASALAAGKPTEIFWHSELRSIQNMREDVYDGRELVCRR